MHQGNVKYFDPFGNPSENCLTRCSKESARWRGKQLGLFTQDSLAQLGR